MQHFTKNQPARLLLKRYADKHSGKVGEARKEIKRRFDYLDWTMQKSILDAFLAAGKTDRTWAYGKLLKYWDDSFIPTIKSLWDEHHEYRCSWLIIRYFPEDYVLRHSASLYEADNYFHICRRLAHLPGFTIDRSRLSPLEYLSVLYHTGRTLQAGEAVGLIYEIIARHCSRGLTLAQLGCPAADIRERGFSPMNIRDVSRAVFYLQTMGHLAEVDTVVRWSNRVTEMIVESQEFRELSSLSVSDAVYASRLADIAVVYMYLHLPLEMMSRFKDTSECSAK